MLCVQGNDRAGICQVHASHTRVTPHDEAAAVLQSAAKKNLHANKDEELFGDLDHQMFADYSLQKSYINLNNYLDRVTKSVVAGAKIKAGLSTELSAN